MSRFQPTSSNPPPNPPNPPPNPSRDSETNALLIEMMQRLINYESFLRARGGALSGQFRQNLIETTNRLKREIAELRANSRLLGLRRDTPLALPESGSYSPTIVEENYADNPEGVWSGDFHWTAELQDKFGGFNHDGFLPNQREVINAALSNRDLFVLMPSGGGKSLTFQLPALMGRGLTLVISPHVSLMEDQVLHARRANIRCNYISSAMNLSQQRAIINAFSSQNSNYKLLFVTPERFARSGPLRQCLEMLHRRRSLDRIVIDEAHCINHWRHDFRSGYQSLANLKLIYPNVPIMALTGSATRKIRDDILHTLGMQDCVVFWESYSRVNLRFVVETKTANCVRDMATFIIQNHHADSGIVYCITKDDCAAVATELREYGCQAFAYHAELANSVRNQLQRDWTRNVIKILCATVSFGMGINKPNVRFVIHHTMPQSLELYIQQCGRAGRDKSPANCVLYYRESDYNRWYNVITYYGGSIVETKLNHLLQMVRYCENRIDCRHVLQLIHLGKTSYHHDCLENCDNCLDIVQLPLRLTLKDVTETAKSLVNIVKSLNNRLSRRETLDCMGCLNAEVEVEGIFCREHEFPRVLDYLILWDVLTEWKNKSSSVLEVDVSNAQKFVDGGNRMIISFRDE